MPIGLKRALLLTVVCLTTGQAFGARTLRSVGDDPVIRQPAIEPMGADQDYDTLAYEDPRRLPWFWSIPDVDGIGDRYPNVRFSSEYAPFYLMEAHLPLFDMFGNQGRPDMRVIVWQSGEIDSIPGYPVQPMDSILVPFEELEFGGEVPIWNCIDLRDLGISFNDLIDFHIGVDIVTERETDTLAIYFDDGHYSQTTRSGIWDGEFECWNHLDDVSGLELPYNFAIHAVISPEPDGVPTVLRPTCPPRTTILQPAYPNPFNERTSIGYFVGRGLPYRIVLFDRCGREIRCLRSGFGSGAERTYVNAAGLAAGVYYISLRADGSRSNGSIILVK